MWKRSEATPRKGTPTVADEIPSAEPTAPPLPPEPAATSAKPKGAATPRPPSLGRSVVITGELTSSEDLTIDGRVNGSIESKQHTVVVGPHAHVKATIFAKEVVVLGSVNGNISATDKIDVREEGTVEGDLTSPTVSIAEGAVFRGSIDMSRQSAESAA